MGHNVVLSLLSYRARCRVWKFLLQVVTILRGGDLLDMTVASYLSSLSFLQWNFWNIRDALRSYSNSPPNKRPGRQSWWWEALELVSVVVHCGFVGRVARALSKRKRGGTEGGNSVGAWHTWFSSLWALCGARDETNTLGRESKKLCNIVSGVVRKICLV